MCKSIVCSCGEKSCETSEIFNEITNSCTNTNDDNIIIKKETNNEINAIPLPQEPPKPSQKLPLKTQETQKNTGPINKSVNKSVNGPIKISDQLPKAPIILPGYTPQQIKQVYKINEIIGGTGKGQIIAIVNAYGYPSLINDLSVFSQQFNLPIPKVVTSLDSLTQEKGKFNIMIHSMAQNVQINNKWILEQSLDIQWAHAIAPDATILVVQAINAGYSSLFSAINYAVSMKATIISLSWGGNESSHQLNFDKFLNLNKNIVFIASSGDTPGVMYPSSSPYVLSVGGTTLNIGTKNNQYIRTLEKVWYTNNTSSTGGGVSFYEKKVYQQNISYTNRVTPDVSFNADPTTGVTVYNSMYSGWLKIGGTSFSAPAWAGIIAIANQKRNQMNKLPLSNEILSAGIYKLLDVNNKSLYAKYFYDITNGKVGYAPVSGLGVPHVNELLEYLSTL